MLRETCPDAQPTSYPPFLAEMVSKSIENVLAKMLRTSGPGLTTFL